MTSAKTTTANETTPRRKRTPSPQHSAPDKVQAVLAVWTERCKPSEVCRQLGVNWITLNYWQRRAMEGMLQALESRVNLSKGEALSPRLQALLQNQQRSVSAGKLTSRLESLRTATNNKLANPPVSAAKPS
jgi:transposase-like protein